MSSFSGITLQTALEYASRYAAPHSGREVDDRSLTAPAREAVTTAQNDLKILGAKLAQTEASLHDKTLRLAEAETLNLAILPCTLENSFLEIAAEAIAVCDLNGNIVCANLAMRNLCGSNPLTLHFDQALALVVVDSPDLPPQPFSIATALNGFLYRAQEVSLLTVEGLVLSLLLSTGLIPGPAGISGCVLSLTEITSRKVIERALIRTEKLASVGRLASTFAHEINNPLEAIGNALYLAVHAPGLPPDALQYLLLATRELERVTHITRQNVAFSPETRAPAPVNVAEILDGMLSLYASRLQTRDIVVDRRYADVPRILAVEGDIRQIISHLLSNSLDSMSDRGRLACSVSRVTTQAGAPAVRFTIADTGSGIAPELLEKIFEPFFTTKEFAGTGLGLWVTRKLVARHGGTLRVRSTPGVGTAFSICFPVEPPPTAMYAQLCPQPLLD